MRTHLMIAVLRVKTMLPVSNSDRVLKMVVLNISLALPCVYACVCVCVWGAGKSKQQINTIVSQINGPLFMLEFISRKLSRFHQTRLYERTDETAGGRGPAEDPQAA